MYILFHAIATAKCNLPNIPIFLGFFYGYVFLSILNTFRRYMCTRFINKMIEYLCLIHQLNIDGNIHHNKILKTDSRIRWRQKD